MFAVRLLTCSFSRFRSNRYQSSSSSVDTTSWATTDTNGLVKQLATRIKAGGPITIAEYMREALLNPKYVS